MPDNTIYVPFMLPISFYEVEPALLPQYLSQHMDDWQFENTIRTQETQGVKFPQKWQTSDTLKLQFESNFGSIQLQVIDCEENVYMTHIVSQVRINKYLTGFYVYEDTIDWSVLEPGTYWITLTLGAGIKTMISEPQILAETHENTLYFEYFNTKHHGDVVFETGIVFAYRVEAWLRKFDPANERTSYRDQRLNPTVLKSIPYRTWELIVGKDYGVPDWVAQKINWIFSCDDVTIDGKSYAVLEDSKMEPIDIDPIYPMHPWTLKIQEGLNRFSKIINLDQDTNKKIFISLSVDTTIHGDLAEPGAEVISIIDTE